MPPHRHDPPSSLRLHRPSLKEFLFGRGNSSLIEKPLNIVWVREAEVSPANSLVTIRMRPSGADDFTLPIQGVAHDRLQPVRFCYHRKHSRMIYFWTSLLQTRKAWRTASIVLRGDPLPTCSWFLFASLSWLDSPPLHSRCSSSLPFTWASAFSLSLASLV